MKELNSYIIIRNGCRKMRQPFLVYWYNEIIQYN